jgi:hypothetical protein
MANLEMKMTSSHCPFLFNYLLVTALNRFLSIELSEGYLSEGRGSVSNRECREQLWGHTYSYVTVTWKASRRKCGLEREAEHPLISSR